MAEPKPTSVIKGIHQAIKGLKGEKEKLGIKRELAPASRHQVALSRLVKAMEKRGWKHSGSGVYTFRGKFKVTVHENFEKGFHVLVADSATTYKLDLGQGAINELDEFVALTEIIASK